MNRNILVTCACASILSAQTATGPDQTKPGAGNTLAASIALNSPMVQSSYQFLKTQTNRIQDYYTRAITIDAILNANVCINSRANLTAAQKSNILRALVDQQLINPPDAVSINGGALAGMFPPLVDDGCACPTRPQPFYSAPGSAYGGHHGFPGGLAVHETANSRHAMSLTNDYRRVYGTSSNGSPVAAGQDVPIDDPDSDVFISETSW